MIVGDNLMPPHINNANDITYYWFKFNYCPPFGQAIN